MWESFLEENGLDPLLVNSLLASLLLYTSGRIYFNMALRAPYSWITSLEGWVGMAGHVYFSCLMGRTIANKWLENPSKRTYNLYFALGLLVPEIFYRFMSTVGIGFVLFFVSILSLWWAILSLLWTILLFEWKMILYLSWGVVLLPVALYRLRKDNQRNNEMILYVATGRK